MRPYYTFFYLRAYYKKTKAKQIMRIKNLLILSFLMVGSIVNGQNTLRVELNNLHSDKGEISVELLDHNKKSIGGKTEKIKNRTCVLVFKDLKEGKYAIQYFHDENSDKKIAKNKIGIPTEGYGFSNDAYGKFGPKKFEKWLFTVKGNTKIEMKTKY